MSKLIPIEHNNERVLTTAQLAEHYGADTDQIKTNFSRNKQRYITGVHYFLLEGDALRTFKREVTNCNLAENINKLYLWTERGAFLHAKSLGTDEAWATYERLIETYFRAREVLATDSLSPQLQLLINIELEQKRINAKIDANDKRLDNIREIVALNPIEWRKDTTVIVNKIANELGGPEHIKAIREEGYKLLEVRFGVSLQTRLSNKRRRMAEEGMCKSKRDNLNQLDVIGEDRKLIEGYIAIIKELAIKYGIEA